jgi:hypothetical protein
VKKKADFWSARAGELHSISLSPASSRYALGDNAVVNQNFSLNILFNMVMFSLHNTETVKVIDRIRINN